MSNREQIQQLVSRQELAVRNKDIDGSMARYAPDIVSFDLVNSLQKVGLAACRKRLETWLAQFPGPIRYEVESLVIEAGDEVAFCHSINHVKGLRVDGNEIDMRWRATVCYRKVNGQWLITHEHGSVPFDVNSGMALMDLKPD